MSIGLKKNDFEKRDTTVGLRSSSLGLRKAYEPENQPQPRAIKEEKVKAKAAKGSAIKGIGKIKAKEVCPFTMKLSAMLHAGLPVLQCIEALEDQTDNQEFRKVCRGIYSGVESGKSFAESLTPYENIFGELYIKMVNAGEQSGDLPAVCAKLAHYMEKSAAIRRKVKSAMMYPTVVIIIATILTLALVTFVVPIFADMFKDMGGELPLPTQMLMAASDLMKGYWYIVFAIVGALFYAFRAYRKSETGGYFLDHLSLRLPMFGQLVTKVVVGRLCRTFASLLQSGMPILQTIKIVGETSGNKYVESAIRDVYVDVENGLTLTEAFQNTAKFPSMMVHMLRAGEKTACIEDMLEKVADFYEDEVDTALEGLSSMLEPLLMVGIGSIVGTIVICMFMPIFNMGNMIK
ncbi:MAG: type II secretion system F family protein [Lentisphaeria bacterium]